MGLREVVKERRGVLGISQIDLAEMAGISLATVKDIERGVGCKGWITHGVESW